MKYYALYKGDIFLATGTAEDIAKQLGISKKTVYFYASNTYKNRALKNKSKKSNRRKLIRLNDEWFDD